MKQRLLVYGEVCIDVAMINALAYGGFWIGVYPAPSTAVIGLWVAIFALAEVYKIKRGVKP